MQKKTMSELDRKSVEEFKDSKKNKIVLVLDDVRSMHNVGACFRTADAFAIEKIIICGISATPPNREITKTALGPTESVDWIYEKETSDAIQHLKQKDYILLAIEQAQEKIYLHEFKLKKNRKYALIFGNEVEGVSQSIMDQVDGCIEIPQEGTKHSLNISVSCGAVLWEFYKQYKTLQ